MKKTLFKLMTMAVISTALFSCEKGGDDNNNETSPSNDGRVYILNEGVWGGNDAELSRYSATDNTIANDYFASKNGRGLGDVANDIEIYGGKMYASDKDNWIAGISSIMRSSYRTLLKTA